ncbi:MAG: suppressor of fused domain protein [Planctomycetota bacterium]|nr:suppressor of fused domain protein [Planctomycetota bacterium]
MSDEAPGWVAIEQVLQRVYPGQQALSWAPEVPASLGGKDKLDAIQAYASADGAHWHLVSFGLSELYEKVSGNAEYSGWGFELTLRAPRTAGASAPPEWTVNMLRQLGGYVFASGRPFEDGHRLDPRSPIGPDPNTKIRALAFIRDPGLAPMQAPFGKLEFLQIVGITLDELEAMKQSSTAQVLGLLRKTNPMLVTDPRRGSVLQA